MRVAVRQGDHAARVPRRRHRGRALEEAEAVVKMVAMVKAVVKMVAMVKAVVKMVTMVKAAV